tara:strand:+ start:80 stop:361 length:282 start_codon:yes stop_codon:yes gene_type:complete
MSTKTKTKKQKLPKWFKGQVYKQGEVVTNPYSKEEYELNAKELSIYDFIIGIEMVIQAMGWENVNTFSMQTDMAKALTWFRINNPQAYMVLLD